MALGKIKRMAHKEQKDFIEKVKSIYPDYFQNKRVLEAGSMYINGSVRDYFENCDYIGIDVGEGKDVDVVCNASEYKSEEKFDTIISCEMLEHSRTWETDLWNMYRLLKPNGLLIITAAAKTRHEHGTTNNQAWASPHTNDYYCGLDAAMLSSPLPPRDFSTYYLNDDLLKEDIQFYGIKIK